MKQVLRYLLLCLILAPAINFFAVPAFAADEPGPSDFLWISPQLFFLNQGQAYSRTVYDYVDTHGDTKNADGSQNHSFETKTQNIEEKLGYGITDRLSLYVIGDYVPSETQKYNYTGYGNVSESFNGFADPTFELAYRAINQKTDHLPFYLDLYASYAPDWVKAKAFSSTEGDGNVSRGGDYANAEVDISHKMKRLILTGFAGLDYKGISKVYNQGSPGVFREDSYFTYYSGFNIEALFSNRFSMDTGVKYLFSDQNVDETNNNGTPQVYQPPGEYIFNLGFNYSLVPATALVELYYNYDLYENSHLNYPDFPADNLTTKNENANVFGARVRFVF